MKFPVKENLRGWWFARSGIEEVNNGPFPTRDDAIAEAREYFEVGEKIDLYDIGEFWTHPIKAPSVNWDHLYEETCEEAEIEFDETALDDMFAAFVQKLIDDGHITSSGWQGEPKETITLAKLREGTA